MGQVVLAAGAGDNLSPGGVVTFVHQGRYQSRERHRAVPIRGVTLITYIFEEPYAH